MKRNFHNLTIKNEAKAGFTIIEVTLSLAFIGMLVVAIAMVLVNILALYQKGLTVKSVNSVGRGIVSELTTSINAAPSVDSTSLCNTLMNTDLEKRSCLESGAFEFLFQARTGKKRDQENVEHDVQYYGALCTGKYTYVWNTYQGIDSGHTINLKYNINSTRMNQVKNDKFKIIRFSDRNYRACSMIAKNKTSFLNAAGNFELDITTLPNGASNYIYEEPTEGFLDSTDVELYLYELTIFPVSQDLVTLRAFFSGTFILATDRGDVNIFRSGDYCNPNAILDTAHGGDNGGSGDVLDLGSEFNYCAVNRFNFAARTSGNVAK